MRYFLLLFIFGFCLSNIGCKTEEEPVQYEFYYYPKTNMYYDVSHKNFIYSVDGANTWDTITQVAQGDPGTMGLKEIIFSTSPEIWKENDQHRTQFGGKPVHIADTSTAVLPAGVSERKVVSKSKPVQVKQPEEKKKKGLGKFFDKIFGKKKKDKNKD